MRTNDENNEMVHDDSNEQQQQHTTTTMTIDEINALSYKELQKKCKSVGLSAGGSTVVLRERLSEYFDNLRKKIRWKSEHQEMEFISTDKPSALNVSTTGNSTKKIESFPGANEDAVSTELSLEMEDDAARRLAMEMINTEQAKLDRLERRLKREKLAAEEEAARQAAEYDRLEKERLEQERLAAVAAAAEEEEARRVEAAEKLAAQQEAERQAKLAEEARLKAEEDERLERERLAELERLEKIRIEKQLAEEDERLAEVERQQVLLAEQQRQKEVEDARLLAEEAKKVAEQAELDRLEKERLESERLEKERLEEEARKDESERIEQERVLAEHQAAEEARLKAEEHHQKTLSQSDLNDVKPHTNLEVKKGLEDESSTTSTNSSSGKTEMISKNKQLADIIRRKEENIVFIHQKSREACKLLEETRDKSAQSTACLLDLMEFVEISDHKISIMELHKDEADAELLAAKEENTALKEEFTAIFASFIAASRRG